MPAKVLVIDDDSVIASAIVLRLRAAGYEVLSAPDGESGLAAAKAHHPDVILLDIRLPDLNGFEVIGRLKATNELSGVPVIFLSANVQDSAKQTACAAGVSGYLSKPYDHKEMISAIQGALSAEPCGQK